MKKGAYIAEQFLEEEFCSLLIFLPDEFIRSVMEYRRLNNPGKAVDMKPEDGMMKLKVDTTLHSYFHSVLSYFPQLQPPSKNLLKIKFEEFVINVLSNTNNPPLATYFDEVRSNSKVSIRDIMEANFAYNMNLQEFARLSQRSLSSFHRDFKSEFNTSPSKWLTQRRLQFAKLLLETTDHNVNDLSHLSGFENPSHFIRVFKQKYGMTPRKFRQSLQKMPALSI